MLWARVVRGISSTEKEVTPVAAIFLNCLHTLPRGRRNPIRTWPRRSRGRSRLAGDVVGAVTEHLKNDVGRAKDLGTIGDDLRALGSVIGIG